MNLRPEKNFSNKIKFYRLPVQYELFCLYRRIAPEIENCERNSAQHKYKRRKSFFYVRIYKREIKAYRHGEVRERKNMKL